jgi:sterol desaturase/sphingolipid hydroxylase (fatty acid hydroxylase superfamily)
MYTLLKSKVGPYPEPSFPSGIDLDAEDHKSRRRLYPVTLIYSIQFAAVLTLAVRSGRLLTALAFVALGVLAWIPIEYFAHRYVLHGVFPKRGLLGTALHHLFDASHADHHARPWDGNYINGHVDTLWVAVVAVPASFLLPVQTAPVFVATVLACYTTEEWLHHAMHFWNLRWPYLQYIRRRHLYHHSRHGIGQGYGVTSGLWDVVASTRISPQIRQLLQTRGSGSVARPQSAPEHVSAHGA